MERQPTLQICSWDKTHYGIMISPEDAEELEDPVEHYVTDNRWSWVKSF